MTEGGPKDREERAALRVRAGGAPAEPVEAVGPGVDDFPALAVDRSAPHPPGSEPRSWRRRVSRLIGFGPGLLLAVRWIQARLISVWGLAIAATLCPPEVFTDLAVFTALANFVSIGVLLRFEAVFFQNSDPARLARAFRLATATGLAVMTVAALVVALLAGSGVILRGFGALFLIALAARAVIRLLTAEATAEGDFATIGNSNIVQAVLQPAMMLLLIWPLGPTSFALLAADAFGHAVAATYLVWRRRSVLARLLAPARWSIRELVVSARYWRVAPRVLLPSAAFSFAFVIVPLMALPYASDAALAAQLALAMRLLEMPMQMFGAVAVPLVMNTLRSRDGPDRSRWVHRLTLRLMAVAIGGFAMIAVAALVADPLLAATQWAGVGRVVALMTLFYAGNALVAPLHEMGAVAELPQRQMLINVVALASVLLTIWFVGDLTPGLMLAVGMVALARMLAHARFAWVHVAASGRST